MNRYHAGIAREEMKKCGYSEENERELFERVEVLLTKKTLARPPLPEKIEELKGEITKLSTKNLLVSRGTDLPISHDYRSRNASIRRCDLFDIPRDAVFPVCGDYDERRTGYGKIGEDYEENLG